MVDETAGNGGPGPGPGAVWKRRGAGWKVAGPGNLPWPGPVSSFSGYSVVSKSKKLEIKFYLCTSPTNVGDVPGPGWASGVLLVMTQPPRLSCWSCVWGVGGGRAFPVPPGCPASASPPRVHARVFETAWGGTWRKVAGSPSVASPSSPGPIRASAQDGGGAAASRFGYETA